MMLYRRASQAGGTYFFTVNINNRKDTLLTDHINLLRDCVAAVKQRHPFHIDAMVVLPDHLHSIWTLPENDSAYASRWRMIKASFSRKLPKSEVISQSRLSRGERGLWQRRYWEHLIRNNDDFERHMDYIHFNPVKHGHVGHASEWPYSSIHRYIQQGWIDNDWAASGEIDTMCFGER